MTVLAKPRWVHRRFVSCSAVLLGLAVPATGIGNHLARHDSGPTADAGWIVAHVAIGALFVVFMGWHVVLNRRALSTYLRSRTRTLPSIEALAALLVVSAVFVLALTLT